MADLSKKLPRITIVTPSYNQARYIHWTVRSVLLQRYPNLEYIVMDGGSTDDTVKVLEPYADRFSYFISENDKGQADAIHRGFARSTGEIMGYLNSDDMLAPGTLDFVARYFQENPGVDVIYSHRITVDAANKVIWHWLLPRHSNYCMKRWDLIPQETCFWRRRIFDQCGNIDPTFRFAMDYDLFVRFMKKVRFTRVNRFLGVFRVHEAAKTSALLATVGTAEIQRVWHDHKIKPHWWDIYVQKWHLKQAFEGGSRYVNQKMRLPGAFPGLGYDYDEVWGGLLNETRLAPRSAERSIISSPQPAPVLRESPPVVSQTGAS